MSNTINNLFVTSTLPSIETLPTIEMPSEPDESLPEIELPSDPEDEDTLHPIELPSNPEPSPPHQQQYHRRCSRRLRCNFF